MSRLEVSGKKRNKRHEAVGKQPGGEESCYDHVYGDRDCGKTDNSRFSTNLKSGDLENQVSYKCGLVIVAKQDFIWLNRFTGL